MGGDFDTSYLKLSIKKLRQRWDRGNLPIGYRYVFPVNYIDAEGISLLKSLQKDYPSVDIRYYDCAQFHKLVKSLEKVGDLQSLVNYIQEVTGK